MSDYNIKLFETLAGLSETVLMSAVAELAREKNYPALREFMAFAARNSHELPVLMKNAELTFSLKQDGLMKAANGMDAPRPQTYLQLLMLPLLKVNESGSPMPVRQLNVEEEAHLMQVVQCISCKPQDFLALMARELNAPKIIDKLSKDFFPFGITVLSTVHTSGSKEARRTLSLGSEAMAHGNLHLAAEFFENMTPVEVKAAVITAVSTNTSKVIHQEMDLLANALHRDPLLGLGILEVLEKKVLPKDLVGFRMQLAVVYIQQSFEEDRLIDTSLLQTIAGTSLAQQKALSNAVRLHASNPVKDFACHMVKAHCIELLPLVRKSLDCTTTPLAQAAASIDDAIANDSARVVGSEGKQRFKDTVQMLMDCNQPLSEQFKDSVLVKLIKFGRTDDRLEKLHVFLALGINPDEKTHLGSNASAYLKSQEKDEWDMLVNSFRAREQSMALLDEMSQSPRPKRPELGVLKRTS